MSEPVITINGQRLTEAQAMTMRVALGYFHIGITAEGLGNDPAHRAIRDGYLQVMAQIFPLMKGT